MRKSQIFPQICCLLAISIFMMFAANGAKGDVAFELKGDQDGISSFHLAIGDYYHVPETQITVVKEQKIPDEELPIVFFLAQRARVTPEVIVNLRLGGKSWLEITHYYGMGADIFFVPVKSVSGPPYGKAYGYYKDKPRKEWKYIKLSDDDVVNLVNLRFISSHYGYAPDDVIRMRSDGKSFVTINKDFKEKGKGSYKESDKPEKSQKWSGSHKSSSKSHGRKRK